MKEIHLVFLDLFSKFITPDNRENAQLLEDLTESLHESFFNNYPDNIEVFKFDLKDYLLDWVSENEIPAIIEKVMAEIKEELTPLLAVA